MKMKFINKKSQGMWMVLVFLLIALFIFLAYSYISGGIIYKFLKNIGLIQGTVSAEACKATYSIASVKPPDVDGDHFPDECDNCPGCPNEDQKDTDGDGIGNKCESNNDAIKKKSKDKKEVIETKLKETIESYNNAKKDTSKLTVCNGNSKDCCKEDGKICCKIS